MWPLVLAVLRRNAVYITLPVAALVGFVGYHLEGLLSDRYTPYLPSVQERRVDRQVQEEIATDVTKMEKLRLKTNVLDTNLPPSLQQK